MSFPPLFQMHAVTVAIGWFLVYAFTLSDTVVSSGCKREVGRLKEKANSLKEAGKSDWKAVALSAREAAKECSECELLRFAGAAVIRFMKYGADGGAAFFVDTLFEKR